ncbi:GNAT family N-acetyltransferase [Thiolinea disciformis]|uniref:GNAT family N-acetyltransferase n=1 Tax=Thiolinea disciformis TaxID=125614 RepID=UPI00036F0274|nr:GNAT family N-acetyltransferase [Thiolinea disciformis]
MPIEYQINKPISVDQFIDVLKRSSLAERRPVDDRACMEGMVANSPLMISAWDGDKLVGVARSLTDFSYACYLSDLAVDRDYQRRGIGVQLQILTQAQLGEKCSLILLAAPAAQDYYGHIGFTAHPRAWILARNERLIV